MIIRPRFSGSLIVLACMCLLQNAHAASIQRWQTAEGTTIYLAERHELPILDITVQFKGAGGADNINSDLRQCQIRCRQCHESHTHDQADTAAD